MAPTTPAAWRDLLEKRLHDRWNQIKVYDDYYEGDHRLSKWLRSAQITFRGTVLGNLLAGLTDNYMTLAVDVAAERLRVQGFRYGDEEADKDAERIWSDNGLDEESNMLHTESIKLGDAYWMVQPNGNEPIITSEHPSQVILANAPGNRRIHPAGLKKWSDGSDVFANVYLPDRVVKYHSTDRQLRTAEGEKRWTTIGAESNPLGEVPIVDAPNNPSMLHGGRSDLAFGAISLQDQITKTIVDLLIGAEYHGLPQRVLLGVDPPRDENGKIVPFEQAAKSRLWYFGNKDAKAHEFSQADLQGLRASADGYIGDLAAQLRIPIYFFRPQAISNISAEALIGLDAGLVSKTNDKKPSAGAGHMNAMRLAFKSINPDDPRARRGAGKILWKNTESRSQAQLTDAVTKEVAIGLPLEAALEKLGYEPDDIDRIMAMRELDPFAESTQAGDAVARNANGSESSQPSAD